MFQAITEAIRYEGWRLRVARACSPSNSESNLRRPVLCYRDVRVR